MSGPNVLRFVQTSNVSVTGVMTTTKEEECVSVVRRRVAERTSEPLGTASAVDNTSVTDVADALQLTVIATSTRPDLTTSQTLRTYDCSAAVNVVTSP